VPGGAGRLREEDSLRQQLAEARAEIAELSRRNSELDSEAGELAAKVGDLDLENQELRQQLAATVAKREDAESSPAATESAPPPDLEALQRRVLSGLKLGKQAPGYKAAAKAPSEFAREPASVPAGTATS
jgi:regulator of replication initiation timing